ncbi:hypothetical protein Plec18170_006677 [Paecilomyces lecythidis]
MSDIGQDEFDWTPAKVLSSIDHPPPERCTTPVPFLHLLERLKTTKREGWRQVGIKTGESIADHMYRMAVMIMVTPPSLSCKLDISRCIRMALVHDMAECLVGDITPLNTEITKGEKGRRESSVMDHIKSNLLQEIPGGEEIGNEIVSLFQEYENNVTSEAHFVHDIDKMEMVLQVFEYERRFGRDLSEFYHVVTALRLPESKQWVKAILEERLQMKNDLLP